MVDFGMDIGDTLRSFSDGTGDDDDDANVLESIRDLINGDKVRAATAIAKDLDDLALSCVDQSVRMIESMERGVDALPSIVEDRIDDKLEAAAKKGARDGDPDLPDVEPAMRDLTAKVEAVERVTLFTVVDAGLDAFKELFEKGALCRELFATIKDFAEDVAAASEAVRDFNVTKMVGKMKDLARDIWRCLRLSNLIKQFAIAIGKLIKWVIRLFKAASEKLGTIWTALAKAKDLVSGCTDYIRNAIRLCSEATNKSTALIDTSRTICHHLDNIKAANVSSVGSLKALADGDEIRSALDLATNMDDVITASAEQVVTMVERVTDAYGQLPDVVKEGMPEESDDEDLSREIPNVEVDVGDLDRCRSAIEQADPLSVARASREGFHGVRDKVSMCRDMVGTSRTFSTKCRDTLESFVGTWDLRSAMDKIVEMRHLIRLGELVTKLSAKIADLTRANIAVIRAAKRKLKSIGDGVLPGVVGDKVEDLMGEVGDKVDDVKDSLQKLKFWDKSQ